MAGHWYGVLGTAPGSGSGSLTLEARHSQWERELCHDDRSDALQILPKMQALYYNQWERIFAWGSPPSFDLLPKHWCEELLNGGALRTAGRSPA
eukprot:8318431-Prorocentrum_lima.AAC.1